MALQEMRSVISIIIKLQLTSHKKNPIIFEKPKRKYCSFFFSISEASQSTQVTTEKPKAKGPKEFWLLAMANIYVYISMYVCMCVVWNVYLKTKNVFFIYIWHKTKTTPL